MTTNYARKPAKIRKISQGVQVKQPKIYTALNASQFSKGNYPLAPAYHKYTKQQLIDALRLADSKVEEYSSKLLILTEPDTKKWWKIW